MDYEQAEQLVARYGQTIYRLAYARTGSREDAEDITQETFLRLVRTNPAFRDEEHRKAWLLRVAANCAGDLFRAPWRRNNRPVRNCPSAGKAGRGHPNPSVSGTDHAAGQAELGGRLCLNRTIIRRWSV